MQDFPFNLPVWDLVSDGLIIADFPIKSIRGITFRIRNGVIHLVYYQSNSHIIVWNFDNKEFEFRQISGSGWAAGLADGTGTELEQGQAITTHIEPDKDNYNYIAINANDNSLNNSLNETSE